MGALKECPDVDELRRLVKDRWSKNRIAGVFGVSHNTATWWIQAYCKTECDEHQWGDWRHTGWGRSAQSNGPGPVDIDIFVRHCKNCPAVESEDRQRDLSSRDGGKR